MIDEEKQPSTTPARERDHAGVVAPPPLIYLVGILLGWGLQALRPAPFLPPALARGIGIPLVAAALVLFVLSIREFRRARTSVRPDRPTTVIIRTGPYRFSRNPLYLALSLLHLGIAAWANSAWLLVTLAFALSVMSAGVIAREERYLERKFGEEYRRYRAVVRRWL